MKEHLIEFIDKSRSHEVRGLRILLEYFYALEVFDEILANKIKIISVFGSARTKPDSPDYAIAHEVGRLLYKQGFAVVTGASRGIMQAGNQGVADAIAEELLKKKKAKTLAAVRKTELYQNMLKKHSVGLSISLPMESENNPFVGVGATFHYFMVRKFFFGSLSSAFIACEGGWGTRDELYEILTLVQTGKAPVMPIIYLSDDYHHLEQDGKHALKKKYISEEDFHLLNYVKTPKEASTIVANFYKNIEKIDYGRNQDIRIDLKKNVSTECRKKFVKMLSEKYSRKLTIKWGDKYLQLNDYYPSSYGTLRRAIDILNQG